jgi:hypothetical protein
MPRNFLPMIVFFTLLGTAALTRDKHHAPAPPPDSTVTDNWAQDTLNTLSLEEKVGQLFMVRMRVEFLGTESPEYLRLREHPAPSGLTGDVAPAAGR